MWEALRSRRLRTLNFRTELNAGFAADGYARVSGRPAPLLLSTGPGALNALTALMESASAHVPVVAIASQIPRDLIGKRRGYLHELPDQLASFAPIVKWSARVDRLEELPEMLAQAWRQSLIPPSGPTYLEIPVDLLTATAPSSLVAAERSLLLAGKIPSPVVAGQNSLPLAGPIPSPLEGEGKGGGSFTEAIELLSHARALVIWAGGGVLRSEAWSELRQLAE